MFTSVVLGFGLLSAYAVVIGSMVKLVHEVIYG